MQTVLQTTGEWHKPARYVTDQKSRAWSIRSDILKQDSLIQLSIRFMRICFKKNGIIVFLFCFWRNRTPQWGRASSFTRFLDHTQRHTTVGRTPLDEWSARRRDLYLTTHNIQHSQKTALLPAGFEPTISADKQPQTHALDSAASETGKIL